MWILYEKREKKLLGLEGQMRGRGDASGMVGSWGQRNDHQKPSSANVSILRDLHLTERGSLVIPTHLFLDLGKPSLFLVLEYL